MHAEVKTYLPSSSVPFVRGMGRRQRSYRLYSCSLVLISVSCLEPNDPLMLAALLSFTLSYLMKLQLFSFKGYSHTVETENPTVFIFSL